MKILVSIIIAAWMALALPLAAQDEWSHLYGLPNSETPVRVKAYGDGVYLLGNTRDAKGFEVGTFTKVDPASGAVIWHRQLDLPSRFNDFAWDENRDNFYLVGHHTFRDPQDGEATESMIWRVDDLGNLQQHLGADLAGEDCFRRIIRHPDPVDPAFPFYVLGERRPEDRPTSHVRIPVVFNFGVSLNLAWHRSYFQASGEAIQTTEAVVSQWNGGLYLLGRENGQQERGALVEITGDGQVVRAALYDRSVNWEDGTEFWGGKFVAAVGNEADDPVAVMGVIDADDLSLTDYLTTPNCTGFSSLTEDLSPTLPGGTYRFLAVGECRTDRNGIYDFFFDGGSGLFPDQPRYFDLNQPTGLSRPTIFYDGNPVDQFWYLDGRNYTDAPFGQREMFLSKIPVGLNGECLSPDRPGFFSHRVRLITPRVIPSPQKLRLGKEPQRFNALDLPMMRLCGDTIPPQDCSLEVTVETDCENVILTANVTGTPPFTINWLALPDGSTSNGPTVELTLDLCGSYEYAVEVTDASGCLLAERGTFNLDTGYKPACEDLVVSASPTDCSAIVHLPSTDLDDCGQPVEFIYSFGSAVVELGNDQYEFPLGVHQVICSYSTVCGDGDRCVFDVEVIDDTPPELTCPPDQNLTAVACSGGAVATWEEPVAADNCEFVLTSSHQSGDVFPFGTTTVTYVAVDESGNETTCSFTITVDRQCAIAEEINTFCTDDLNRVDFVITGVELPGGNANDCQFVLIPLTAGVSLENVVYEQGPDFTIAGTLVFDGFPPPTTVQLSWLITCFCNDGPSESCRETLTLDIPCCNGLSLEDAEVCASSTLTELELPNCEDVPSGAELRWYVAPGPCPPADGWGEPYFVTLDPCAPLSLYPYVYSVPEVCVFVEAALPGGDGCNTLVSEVVTVTLCPELEPTVNNQEFCYEGDPITPAPLTLDLPADYACDLDVRWFDDAGSEVGTGPTLEIGSLSYDFNSNECSYRFNYTAKISGPCGEQSVTGGVTLINVSANAGDLATTPSYLPICNGGDAILTFTPNCDLLTWTWQQSTDGINFVDLPQNGQNNNTYYTNILTETTFYRVVGIVGGCTLVSEIKEVSVLEEFVITDFTAEYEPPCVPEFIRLEVALVPDLPDDFPCAYDIEFYQDGELVAEINASDSPFEVFIPIPPQGTRGGVFHARVRNACCGIDELSPARELGPPIEAKVSGPCFRCLDDPQSITLTGILENAPDDLTCTHRWFYNGTELAGETEPTLDISVCDYQALSIEHIFTWVSDCSDGCVRKAKYRLFNCGDNVLCLVGDDDDDDKLGATVSPNPTADDIVLTLTDVTTFAELALFDQNGRPVRTYSVKASDKRFTLSLRGLNKGTYFLRGVTTDKRQLEKRILLF